MVHTLSTITLCPRILRGYVFAYAAYFLCPTESFFFTDCSTGTSPKIPRDHGSGVLGSEVNLGLKKLLATCTKPTRMSEGIKDLCLQHKCVLHHRYRCPNLDPKFGFSRIRAHVCISIQPRLHRNECQSTDVNHLLPPRLCYLSYPGRSL